jgi:endo-1,4-beta-xylanase
MTFTRREILGGGLALLGTHHGAMAQDEARLARVARTAGLFYGAAVTSSQLTVADFSQSVIREADFIVREWEMKWGVIEKVRGTRQYGTPQKIVDFANANGLSVRGHTLVWHRNIPAWAVEALNNKEYGVMQRHIRSMVANFGVVQDWDVVNEAIEPTHGRADNLRESPFLTALGPGYIGEAFRSARAMAPGARLVYNDYGFEYELETHRKRRRALIRLLERLKVTSVPVDAVGLQAHLVTRDLKFDPVAYAAFLKKIADLGLKIIITELDIQDTDLPADIGERDRILADHIARYLDVVLAEPAVTGVLTWGLSDRYTWLNNDPKAKRPDGLPSRPLPLDDKMQRKPIWDAIANAFRNAPERS